MKHRRHASEQVSASSVKPTGFSPKGPMSRWSADTCKCPSRPITAGGIRTAG